MLPQYIRAIISESGLDIDEFERLALRLAAGHDLVAANLVGGQLEAPTAIAWTQFSKNAIAYKQWGTLGIEALQRGQLGLVILNGGMATRFGNVVKGTVAVEEGCSFLGLKLRDALRAAREAGGEPPIVILMNSQATHEGTMAHLAQHNFFGYPPERVWSFLQCWAVRFTPTGDLYRDRHGDPSFYGPGHGDVVGRLRESGLLNRFLDAGGRHLLLTNVDNAVAGVDPALFGLHLAQGAAVTVEVVERLAGDQGGAPFLVDGHLQIVEGFRLPRHVDVTTVPVFNTNTFWLEAQSLKTPVDLTWFAVPKRVDDVDVIQFERLVGELTAFTHAEFARVSRVGLETRFIPVKTPDDLDRSRDLIVRALKNQIRTPT